MTICTILCALIVALGTYVEGFTAFDVTRSIESSIVTVDDAAAPKSTTKLSLASPPPTPNMQFITRNGSSLMLDNKPFVWGAGANIYWLGLDENEPPATVAAPSEFRQFDALATAKLMGSRVVRSHTLGISCGHLYSFEPSLDVFNATALVAADRAISIAASLGLRLIVPLTDNYNYYHGGRYVFCAWFNRSQDCDTAFYSDNRIVSAYERYITQLLSHKNHFNGLVNSENPVFLAWETGNELRPPVEWTKRIAALLHRLAPRTLVVDGSYGINAKALTLDEVDIYSDHLYPPRLLPSIVKADAALVHAAHKVFLIGEFQWNFLDDVVILKNILNAFRSSRSLNLYWSLFPHRDALAKLPYGFEQHNDCCTLHFTPFLPPSSSHTLLEKGHRKTNDQYNATAIRMLMEHAAAMSGERVSKRVSTAPTVSVANVGRLAWLGAAGAANYSIYTSPTNNGDVKDNWTEICTQCVCDAALPFMSDGLRASLYVKVVAYSVDGERGPESAVARINDSYY